MTWIKWYNSLVGYSATVEHHVEQSGIGAKNFRFPANFSHNDFKEAKQMQDQAQFFVGWGTLSLINAGLAQSKRRSGFLWWLLSLFLGPIATFLIVVLPESPKA